VFAATSLSEAFPKNLFAPDGATAGTLRITRSGTTIHYYQRPSGAVTWNDIGMMAATAAPAHVTLSAYANNVARAFTASFDNFQLTAGASDDVEYVQQEGYRRPADFSVAAVLENYPAQRYWRQAWGAKDFMDYAKGAGFDTVEATITMTPAPELAATPASDWGTLAWQPYFWGSREYTAETLKQAKARGLRLDVRLTLSPGAAWVNYQESPSQWLSKTPDEIVPLLKQNVYETVSYIKGLGLDVEKWAIGNEVDNGILNFLPNQRIAVPPGINPAGDMQWMRDNVWPVEAKLLKAAAAGVAQADPSAKIVLHIAGLEATHGNVFAPAFFQFMHDAAVPFDYAALSHPYAEVPGNFAHYSAACWFKHLSLSLNRLTAATGKPTMFAEASYPAANAQGIVSPPLPDFPFTPAGQAKWVHQELRFAASLPNFAGWHYFYPDMASDVISDTPEVAHFAATALFYTSTSPRPALYEFRVAPAAFSDGFE
jgi:arabinogalactan endo-1,4-beta-galactosidase